MSAVAVLLRLDGEEYTPVEEPAPGDPSVRFPVPCPGCSPRAEEIRVRGTGISRRTHDACIAAAVCASCGGKMGEIVARVDTIFGLEEDERVLRGRPRVY